MDDRRRASSSVSSRTSSEFQLRRKNSLRGGVGGNRRFDEEVEVHALLDSSQDARLRMSDTDSIRSENPEVVYLIDEEERQSNWDIVDNWKQRRMKLAGGLNYLRALWQNVSLSRALYDGLHEITILGDFLFERYFHFWQILRNTHFAKILPSVLITRIFFRGIYLMVVGTKKEDFYAFEWKIRQDISHSFRLDKSRHRSYFYTFYVDILIELVFIAFISKANNATFNRALSARLRNWQWLFLGIASLALCIIRDISLTLFNLDPNTLQEKTQNIIHTIGTLIIALCDIIMVLTFIYIIIIHLALTWHDLEIYRRIQENAQDDTINVISTNDSQLPQLVEENCSQDEENPPKNETEVFTSNQQDQSYAQHVEAVVVEYGKCSSCISGQHTTASKRAARIDARRHRRRAFRQKIRQRALTATKNFRIVLNQRIYAPDYVFREADQRSLLASLLHPPGACAGLFTADDFQRKDDIRIEQEIAKHHPDTTSNSWFTHFKTMTAPPHRGDRPSFLKSTSWDHSDATRRSSQIGSVTISGEMQSSKSFDETTQQNVQARMTTSPQRNQSIFFGEDVKRHSRRHKQDSAEKKDKVIIKPEVSTHQKIARTFTHTLFGGLFTQPVPGAYQLTTLSPAQKRAMRLSQLHLNERVDELWQNRVRNRSYQIHARLWMACIMGWLLAVAATAGLGYGAWALQQYVERRLDWIDDQITDVRLLLDSYLVFANGTSSTSDALLERVQSDLSTAISSFKDETEAEFLAATTAAVEDVVGSLAATANSSSLNKFLKNDTLIEDAVASVANETSSSFNEYESSVATLAANIIIEYLERYYDYVVDYEQVLRTWLRLAKRASRNTFTAGIVGSGIAFVLMNYSLLMTVARFREATLRFRETGMIDDMDLLIDESLQEPATRSEWFWIVMTAPSAPYAVAFVGMAVSNMLIISIMVMLIGFIITGASLFPGAMDTTRNFLTTHIGDWYIIYPIIYCLDWFYLNAFIADRTYIIHRGCFDLWDFILGTWKLVTGLFGGVIRLILIYLIATMNTIRIDWTIFTGRIGWLDIGYNAFASAVMLTERHVSPTLMAASRLLLSAVPDAYSRRTCSEHVLIFDVAARSRVLSAAHDARDLPDLFERVLMEDHQALCIVQRARVGLAWRLLHLVWILVANPSLVTWNVKKWRENPISFATWRRARDRLRKRRERDLKKRRASAILEVADRELHNQIDTSASLTPPKSINKRRSQHKAESTYTFSSNASTSLDSQHSTKKNTFSTRISSSISSSRRSALSNSKRYEYLVQATNFIFPNAMGRSTSSAVRARRRGASVIDRIDRLEAVIDERLPEQRLCEEAVSQDNSAEESIQSPRRRRGSGKDLTVDVQVDGQPDAEREAIVAEPEDVAGVLTQFQLGYLRTTFRLLDKDQDELVTVNDLKIHYNSQGLVLTDEEARAIIDTVSVVRKGYYTTQRHSDSMTCDIEEEYAGISLDLHEIEKYGFDFPEFLAYLLWRLKEEEALAFLLGVSSGIYLDDKKREASLKTAFVRFKGYDERAIDMNDHIQRPLNWAQFKALIKRTRLDRGPFGLYAAESRILFDLLCLGAKAGEFEPNIETLICKECGPFFAGNKKSITDQNGVDFETVSAFFDSSIYGRAGRKHLRDLNDDMTETSSVTEMDLTEVAKLAAFSHLGDSVTKAEAEALDEEDDNDDSNEKYAHTFEPNHDENGTDESKATVDDYPPRMKNAQQDQEILTAPSAENNDQTTRPISMMQLEISSDDEAFDEVDEMEADLPVTGLDDDLEEDGKNSTHGSQPIDNSDSGPLRNAWSNLRSRF